jgi:hypothetical protein
MDPNLFHLDWERTAEVLTTITVLAFLLERALAPIFEHRGFLKRFASKGVKEMIAFGVSVAVCLYWQFDAFSMIILTERTTPLGAALTGAIVAGGSKASIKLFHDVLNIRSSAHEQVYPTTVNDLPSSRPNEEAVKAL